MRISKDEILKTYFAIVMPKHTVFYWYKIVDTYVYYENRRICFRFPVTTWIEVEAI